ncbi:MAG: SusC/RagA family TonB-linked outer membrane protein [Chitinophagaceae bacterium]|nr:SusC/RagA family TonB-linked outer membrane protein [Chitinophagaceae bacterium]
MKRYITLIILLLSIVHSQQVFAQNADLRGKVETITGQPISGATISVNLQATTSGADGRFYLKNVSKGSQLSVTCIGYVRKTLITEPNNDITIKLVATNEQLDEVVIQAYGTTTQRLNTGNISRVTAKEIASQPISNPLEALAGRVAGLTISQTSGVPGAALNIQIRGRSSLDQTLSQNNPLFIIDGIFFEAGNNPYNLLRSSANNQLGQGGLSPLNNINPADIESIEVLKDADATAIYGSKGANGVILITTKKGKAGKTSVTANVYSGFSTVARSIKMLSTSQYVAMRKEGFKNDGITPSRDPSDPGFAPDITLWDTTRNTDFKKLLLGNTAHASDAQVSLNGGSTFTQFNISGGYHRETNVFSNDFADQKASLHFSLNHISESKKFTLVFSGGYVDDRNDLISADLTKYINLPPNLQLRDAQGNLTWQEAGINFVNLNNIGNPLAIFNQRVSAGTENLFSNLSLGYKIWRQLILKVGLNYNDFRSDESALFPSSSIDPSLSSFTRPSSNFANSERRTWMAEPQLTYSADIGKGVLNVLLGSTFEENRYRNNILNATNFSSDLLLNNPAAAGTITTSIDQQLYHYAAVFGRLNYDWQNKYLINATFRRDGSSRFGPGRQFANFGAIGAAWVFSEESVVTDALPFISFGKLRGSYGVTGNDQINNYSYLNLYRNATVTYQGQATLIPTNLYNADYGWEINRKLEAAIELGFLKDRIFLSVAAYRQRSSNQLINYTLPRQTGFQSVILNLPALVQNSGLEILLTTKNITGKNFKWSTSVNITLPKNRLLDFPNLGQSTYSGLYTIGQPLSVISAFRYTGVDRQTGLYTFQDVNKDGVMDGNDYQPLGNLDPKFYGGISNSIMFHQFQLDFLFEFKKQKGLNYLAQVANNLPGTAANLPALVLDRWQKPGDNASIQQFSAGNNFDALIAQNVNLLQSDALYSDASYIRLKNVALGYIIPETLTKKLKLGYSKIFINAQNLLTITGYKGLDPETQNFYVLPPLRTIAVGIQLTF